MLETQTINHVHTYPDAQVEAVKIEKNSRGFNVEVKAATVKRALELYDHTVEEMNRRVGAEG